MPDTTGGRITVEQVAEAMTLLPIDDLTPHPLNNNVGARDAIRASVDEFGFFDPIIVQKSTGHIISGNHRWLDLKDRGVLSAPCLVYDVDDDTARRMMLAVNRTARLGRDDEQATFRLLRIIEEHAGASALAGTGWTPDDYEDLMAKFDAPATLPVPEQVAASYAETPEEVDHRAAVLSTRGRNSPKLLGLRDVVFTLTLAEHAELVDDLNACKKAFPGDYPTGRIVSSALALLREMAAQDPDMHPPRCPCQRCPGGTAPAREMTPEEAAE